MIEEDRLLERAVVRDTKPRADGTFGRRGDLRDVGEAGGQLGVEHGGRGGAEVQSKAGEVGARRVHHLADAGIGHQRRQCQQDRQSTRLQDAPDNWAVERDQLVKIF